MAKVVLTYQHRDSEPSFTIVLKDNHLISFSLRKIDSTVAPPARYRFYMTLNLLTSYMRVNQRTPHAIDFVLAPGTHNLFPVCDFVWVPPVTAVPFVP